MLVWYQASSNSLLMSGLRILSRQGADSVEFSTILRLVTNESFSYCDYQYF